MSVGIDAADMRTIVTQSRMISLEVLYDCCDCPASTCPAYSGEADVSIILAHLVVRESIPRLKPAAVLLKRLASFNKKKVCLECKAANTLRLAHVSHVYSCSHSQSRYSRPWLRRLHRIQASLAYVTLENRLFEDTEEKRARFERDERSWFIRREGGKRRFGKEQRRIHNDLQLVR